VYAGRLLLTRCQRYSLCTPCGLYNLCCGRFYLQTSWPSCSQDPSNMPSIGGSMPLTCTVSAVCTHVACRPARLPRSPLHRPVKHASGRQLHGRTAPQQALWAHMRWDSAIVHGCVSRSRLRRTISWLTTFPRSLAAGAGLVQPPGAVPQPRRPHEEPLTPGTLAAATLGEPGRPRPSGCSWILPRAVAAPQSPNTGSHIITAWSMLLTVPRGLPLIAAAAVGLPRAPRS
jgi:hypothetical protein